MSIGNTLRDINLLHKKLTAEVPCYAAMRLPHVTVHGGGESKKREFRKKDSFRKYTLTGPSGPSEVAPQRNLRGCTRRAGHPGKFPTHLLLSCAVRLERHPGIMAGTKHGRVLEAGLGMP